MCYPNLVAEAAEPTIDPSSLPRVRAALGSTKTSEIRDAVADEGSLAAAFAANPQFSNYVPRGPISIGNIGHGGRATATPFGAGAYGRSAFFNPGAIRAVNSPVPTKSTSSRTLKE